MADEKDVLGVGLIVAGVGVLVAHHRAEETPIEMGDGSFHVSSDTKWIDHDDYGHKKCFRHPTKKRWKRVLIQANGQVLRLPIQCRRKVVLTVTCGEATVTCESNAKGKTVFLCCASGRFPDHFHEHEYYWEHKEAGPKISSLSLVVGGEEQWSSAINNSYPVRVAVVCGCG